MKINKKGDRPLFYLKKGACPLFLFLLLTGTPPAETILEKVDANYIADTRKVIATMIVKEERATRTLQSQAWIQGAEKSYAEYLSPARDKGTKMLKLRDQLWTYTPSTDRTVQIAGHMLRMSVMGSDLSYEDYMEDRKLIDMYNAEITGEEDLNGRSCYALKLTARVQDVAYYSRKIWVDKEWYIPMREERYAKGGKLLKTLVVNQVFKVGERWYPKDMVFKDVLKDGEGTEFIIDSIEFDVEIPDYLFSKASLRKS